MNKDLKKLTIGISIILILSIASIFAYKNYKQERTNMMARITLEKSFKLVDKTLKDVASPYREKTEKEEQESYDRISDIDANDKDLKSYMKELSPKNERKINKLIAEHDKKASRKILKDFKEKDYNKDQETKEQKEKAKRYAQMLEDAKDPY